MDSGVSILNFSMCRKVLSLLRSITGLHLHFLPFRWRFLTAETGYNRLTLGLLEGPCILILSEEI